MKKVCLFVACLVLIGSVSVLAGCKNSDVSFGPLGIHPLGNSVSLSNWETQYAKGDYSFFQSLSYSDSWSTKEKYLYLRALFHLRDWAVLSQVMKKYRIPFTDPLLGPYLLAIALRVDIQNKDTVSAKGRYNIYLRYQNKFSPHLSEDSIKDSYAAFLNDPSKALSKGGFHYYRYDQDSSRVQDFFSAVKAKYPAALRQVKFADFQKAVPKSSWKSYLESLKILNSNVYLDVLKALGERSVISEYYFKKASYGRALRYAPRGSFTYYASLLATSKKKDLPPDVWRYVREHASRIAYYHSQYEFTMGNYGALKTVQTKHYAPRALRYLVVLGLNTQSPSELLGTLMTINNKFGHRFVSEDKELALFWIAVLTAITKTPEDAQSYYVQVSREFPNTYYGSEALERLSPGNRSALLVYWNKLSEEAKKQEQSFIKSINDYTLPNNLVLQRAMFFLRIREDIRGRKYLREFTEGVNSKSAPVSYALARQFYQAERMDYFALYISRFLRTLRERFPHTHFYSDVMSMLYPIKFETTIRDAARTYNLDPSMLKSLILQESWFDPMARSWAGAQGLSQLMPATFASMTPALLKKNIIKNEDVWDIHTNIFVGAAYLSWLMHKMYKDFPLDEKIIWSYSSYNAGPGHMKKAFKDIRRPLVDTAQLVETIDYRETRNYTKKLIYNQRMYSRILKAKA